MIFIIGLAAAGWIIFTPYSIYKLFTELPSTRVWIFIGLSWFIHFFYFVLLGRAYSKFELSIVYPIARGLSVFLIPIYGIFILGESMTFQAITGCAFIILGILLTGSQSIIYSLFSSRNLTSLLRGGVVSAVMIGFIISFYSLADKNAAEHVDPVLFVWITDSSAILLLIFYLMKDKEKSIIKYLNVQKYGLVIPGVFQFASYAIIIYAYATTQLSYAGTFREIGSVFGAVMAYFILGEKFSRMKILGISIIILGAVLISIF